MPSSPASTIHQHPEPLNTLAPHLSTHLPNTICLLRRIQFHAQSPEARTYATFPPGQQPPRDQIWTAAFVDRSRAPETECWVFSSIELLASPTASFSQTTTLKGEIKAQSLSKDQNTEARAQLIALFATIRALGVPDVFAEQAPDQSSNTLIVGAMHEETVSILTGLSTSKLKEGRSAAPPAISNEAPARTKHETTPADQSSVQHVELIKKHPIPYLKFLYSIPMRDAISAQESSAAEEHLLSSLDLSWSTIQAGEDCTLVRSRTAIPRRDRTLLLLPCAALRTRHDGKLVSWAFLAPDGGLSTLHVEPEFRGKGLGKAVAARVLGLLGRGLVGGKGFRGLDGEVATGCVWSYSHAAIDNRGSIGVAKSLGGREAWIVYWIHVNLDQIEIE